MTNTLMTPEETVKYLAKRKVIVTVTTLRDLRCKSYGGKLKKIDFVKVNNRVRYRQADVDAWVEGI